MLRTLHDTECIKRKFKFCACVDQVDFAGAALVQDGKNRCLFRCVRRISSPISVGAGDSFNNDVDLVEKLPGFLREDVDRRDLNLMVPCNLQGQNVYAVADCGSMVSCISPEQVRKLNLKINTETGNLTMAQKDMHVPRIGTVRVKLAIGSHRHEVTLEVLDIGEPLLLGLDLFPTFGIRVEGIPVDFPGAEKLRDALHLLSDDIVDEDKVIWNEADRLDSDVVARIREVCADVMAANESIPRKHVCSHPSSVVSLDTGQAEPKYRRQYPVSRRFESFIDDQVRDWLRDGVIERGRIDSPWNSPLLVRIVTVSLCCLILPYCNPSPTLDVLQITQLLIRVCIVHVS